MSLCDEYRDVFTDVDPITGEKSPVMLSWRDAESMIDYMQGHGWVAYQVSDGVLGIGDWILVPEDACDVAVCVREVATTVWTSQERFEVHRLLERTVVDQLEAVGAFE
jgi:hypothetical protein